MPSAGSWPPWPPIRSQKIGYSRGGTCLRKCYFETYRFSEDLDFTIQAEESFDESMFLQAFREISAWVYDQSGLELPKEGMTFETYQNPRGRPSMEGRLSYRGPLAPRGALPRITASTVTRWGLPVSIETIRYAGTNRLCVQIHYRELGTSPARALTIEPYSIRKLLDGNIILFGLMFTSRKTCSFRLDWIEKIKVTDHPFTPTFLVEFT